ncbi:unnamed protein product, partial [Prorocentrum cordatum]
PPWPKAVRAFGASARSPTWPALAGLPARCWAPTTPDDPALLAMMRAGEQAQRSRMQRQAAQPLAVPRPRPPAEHGPAWRPSGLASSPSKPRDPAPVGGEVREETVPLTADEAEWLSAVAARQGHPGMSSVLQKLLHWANSEPPAAKRKIFLVIRCRRCSAGARGGAKSDHLLALPAEQWQWLQNVKERCGHASVAKTVRIIVDFYMPMCQADPALEEKALRAGRGRKTGRHSDAVGNVDPLRAPRGRRASLQPGQAEVALGGCAVGAGVAEAKGKLSDERAARHWAVASSEGGEADLGGASTVDAFHETDSDATQGGLTEDSAADAWEEPSR